jgi:hypothetical protein
MLKKLTTIAACLAIGLAALSSTAAESSLRDQILAIDKELKVMRKATESDPEVKAARVELQVYLDRLNATVDSVVARTNPKGKELLEKHKKLLEQYRAQQKTENVKQ